MLSLSCANEKAVEAEALAKAKRQNFVAARGYAEAKEFVDVDVLGELKELKAAAAE